LGERFDSLADEASAFLKLVRDRTYETRIERKSLIALRAQHLADADLVSIIRKVRVNLDFDLKRKPTDARDQEGLLTAPTVPWETIADFERARDGLEAWKRSQRRVLKTSSDYNAMISWAESVSVRCAAGVKSDNSLNPDCRFPSYRGFRCIWRKARNDHDLGG
jgi:hypothetical protein